MARAQTKWLSVALWGLLGMVSALGQEASSQGAGEMVTVERVVDRALKGSSWVKAEKGDSVEWAERIRTGELSRAAIEISTGGVLRLSELTVFELKPPPSDQPEGRLRLTLLVEWRIFSVAPRKRLISRLRVRA